MDDETQNKSWAKALELYDSLLENGWPHIPGFRNLVATLASSQEAWGLTAFTSHETLIVSPYTRYPDKLDERHVSVHPLSDGTVRIEKIPGRFDRYKREMWTLPLHGAEAKIRELIADL